MSSNQSPDYFQPTDIFILIILYYFLQLDSFAGIISKFVHLMNLLFIFSVSFMRVNTSLLCPLFEPSV